MGLREDTSENKMNKPAEMVRKVGIKSSSIPLVPKKKQKLHKNYHNDSFFRNRFFYSRLIAVISPLFCNWKSSSSIHFNMSATMD